MEAGAPVMGRPVFRCRASRVRAAIAGLRLVASVLGLIAGVSIMAAGGAHASVLDAVEQRDLPGLERAIAAGDPVDERNAEGQTPLLVAVWNDDVDAAGLLIEAGADVNAKDRIADSPFLVAGAHGRIKILRMILAHGADLGSINRFGGTALIPAAEKGHPEAVAMLIAAGVDVNHVNRLGWTALLEAVILTDGGPTYQRIVGLLLDGGADPDIPDRDGRTALDHARAKGYDEIVALLEAHAAGNAGP